MAGRAMLTVICYDIASDRTRRRVAERLEEVAVRVQLSVFEAWLDRDQAARLVAELGPRLGPEDSLRLYQIAASGLRHMHTLGPTAPAAARAYHLL